MVVTAANSKADELQAEMDEHKRSDVVVGPTSWYSIDRQDVRLLHTRSLVVSAATS